MTTGSPPKSPAAEAEPGGAAGQGGQQDAAGQGGSEHPSAQAFLPVFLRNVWSANTVMVSVLAVVLAMLVGGVLILVSDEEVLAAFGYFFAAPSAAASESWRALSEAYTNLFKGAILDPAQVRSLAQGTGSWDRVLQPVSETLTYAAPLVFTGLAVALAFRGGLFNIGAQGQALLGAIGAATLGFALGLPPVLHMLVALLGAALAGAAWGFVPGILKARTGAHEVITTIMLNHTAALFLGWLIVQRGIQDPNRSDAISKPVHRSSYLLDLPGPTLRANLGIVFAVLACAAIAWLLNRSTFGFELRAVGSNPAAARTAGMSVGRTYVLVMAISGALAGLGGAAVVLGTEHTLTPQVVGQIGFNGILVALLGRARPWGVLLGGLLFGALQAGGNRMQSYAQISVELVTVLQAMIVLFIAAPAFVKTIFQLRAARAARLETSMAKGW
ncbi:MAG: ABC transporter permease [Micromonosporaceae bacterium]